jgi:hypothetical protein
VNRTCLFSVIAWTHSPESIVVSWSRLKLCLLQTGSCSILTMATFGTRRLACTSNGGTTMSRGASRVCSSPAPELTTSNYSELRIWVKHNAIAIRMARYCFAFLISTSFSFPFVNKLPSLSSPEKGSLFYFNWLGAGLPGHRGSIPGRGERIFPLASVPRPARGPTQPPVQWVPGFLAPGG